MTRLLLLALSRVLPNRYGVQLDAGESVEHPLVAMNYILRSIRAGILGAVAVILDEIRDTHFDPDSVFVLAVWAFAASNFLG